MSALERIAGRVANTSAGGFATLVFDGVESGALDLSRFEKNPVVLFNGDTSKLPLGKVTDIEDDDAGELTMSMQFASTLPNDDGDNLWLAVEQEFVSSASLLVEDGEVLAASIDTLAADDESSVKADHDDGDPDELMEPMSEQPCKCYTHVGSARSSGEVTCMRCSYRRGDENGPRAVCEPCDRTEAEVFWKGTGLERGASRGEPAAERFDMDHEEQERDIVGEARAALYERRNNAYKLDARAKADDDEIPADRFGMTPHEALKKKAEDPSAFEGECDDEDDDDTVDEFDDWTTACLRRAVDDADAQSDDSERVRAMRAALSRRDDEKLDEADGDADGLDVEEERAKFYERRSNARWGA